jgi:hypothetical protein
MSASKPASATASGVRRGASIRSGSIMERMGSSLENAQLAAR